MKQFTVCVCVFKLDKQVIHDYLISWISKFSKY